MKPYIRNLLLAATVAAAAASLSACAPMEQSSGTQGGAVAGQNPKFAVDPYWPKPLPGTFILGQVAGVAVDAKDHVWIVHRPATLLDDEKGTLHSWIGI